MILNGLLDKLDCQAPVRDIRIGLLHTAVLTRHCRLAASLPREALKQKPPLVKDSGQLLTSILSQKF